MPQEMPAFLLPLILSGFASMIAGIATKANPLAIALGNMAGGLAGAGATGALGGTLGGGGSLAEGASQLATSSLPTAVETGSLSIPAASPSLGNFAGQLGSFSSTMPTAPISSMGLGDVSKMMTGNTFNAMSPLAQHDTGIMDAVKSGFDHALTKVGEGVSSLIQPAQAAQVPPGFGGAGVPVGGASRDWGTTNVAPPAVSQSPVQTTPPPEAEVQLPTSNQAMQQPISELNMASQQQGNLNMLKDLLSQQNKMALYQGLIKGGSSAIAGALKEGPPEKNLPNQQTSLAITDPKYASKARKDPRNRTLYARLAHIERMRKLSQGIA